MVSNEDTSRRHILRSFAGLLTIDLSSHFGSEKYISPHTLINLQSMSRDTTTSNLQSDKRPAYIALPGLNVASLLANIPSIMEEPRGPMPVFFMDTYDYNWLQALALKKNNQLLIKNVAMAYGHLYQRGVIQLIDYTDFYSESIQQTNIQRNRSLIEDISVGDHQTAAVRATEGWKKHVRGSYLDTFRSDLGQKQKKSRKTRREEDTRKQKLKQGLGTPIKWNKRILDKHVAALKIRRYVDDAFDHLNVKSVVGEGESGIISDFLDAASSTTDVRYITDLDPAKHVKEGNIESYADTRGVFNTIGEIATKREGVQHNDWVMLGPTLAFPQYNKLFDLDKIEDEIEDGEEVTPEQVAEVVTTLERRTEDRPDSSYAAEWFKESEIFPFASIPDQWNINKAQDHAENLMQYSREIRSLDDDVPEAAALIGASIVRDPSPRNDPHIDAVYQRGEDLITQFAPHSFTESQINASFRRTDEYDTSLEWYEDDDQPR